MQTWNYKLADGNTGTVEAPDDNEAWIAVFALVGQCPDVIVLDGILNPEADKRGQL